MSDEEKEEFLSNVRYFWLEKGHLGFSGYSLEKFREADPVIATAFERMQLEEETFVRLLKAKVEDW